MITFIQGDPFCSCLESLLLILPYAQFALHLTNNLPTHLFLSYFGQLVLVLSLLDNVQSKGLIFSWRI